MNSLKDHINAALAGSETTGVNVNPWRVGDGYTTPNIHQPCAPSPADIKALEWERLRREIMNVRTPTTTSTATELIVDPATSRNRTIRFKGIVFTVYLSDEAMEFFEDDRHVTRGELRLLEITHPKEYAKIKQVWIAAWKELQALNAFEND